MCCKTKLVEWSLCVTILYYSFLKSDSTVAERLNSVYEKDFTFYFSSFPKKPKVNCILADLISPRIFKNHCAEESNKEYQLNQNSEEIDFKILSFIIKKLEVPTMKEIEEIEENKDNNKNDTNIKKEKKEKRKESKRERTRFFDQNVKVVQELGNKRQ